MLKVLVIDDEKLVRQMVMSCIDWEEIGLEICGEASSGRMGMELVEELHPDMVFIDVRMPGMDGLTCSRLILEQHPQIKVMILSGHSEFEYASEGIRIGVFDYLLKPINEVELRKAAMKARDAILEERDHRKEFERYREELKKHAEYIRDRQLAALIRGKAPEQYIESLAYFGVNLKEGIYQVALVNLGLDTEKVTEEEKILRKMHIRTIVADYYGDMPGIFVVDSGSSWMIILNNEKEDAIYSNGEELQRYLENNTGTGICLGVGNVYQDIHKLRESYREAKDALKYRFVSPEEGVIYFRDIYPYYNTENEAVLNEELLHELGNALRISDQEKGRELLTTILQNVKKSGELRQQIEIGAVQILAEIMKVLSELKLENGSEFMNYSTLIEGVFSKDSFDEIQEHLRRAVDEACTLIGHKVSDKEKNLVHRVKDYLEENYASEDLSLSLVADTFYVNASYLSRVFREKTGMTFSNYLMELRMQAAKKLIKGTDMRAYEIAEKVGIPDPHYFSARFKKFTGMSVSEFKRRGE